MIAVVCYRNSRLQMFFKIGVLKNFEVLTGKHIYRSLFFNKVTGIKASKRLQHRFFTVNIVNFLKAAFLKEHICWLLLPF